MSYYLECDPGTNDPRATGWIFGTVRPSMEPEPLPQLPKSRGRSQHSGQGAGGGRVDIYLKQLLLGVPGSVGV